MNFQNLDKIFSDLTFSNHTLESLPNEVLHVVWSYLPLKQVLTISELNKFFNSFRKSPLFESFIKRRILTCPWEGLGLTSHSASSSTLKISQLIELVSQWFQESTMQQLYCFKSSGGVDQNYEQFSMVHLFNPLTNQGETMPTNTVFSNCYGRNVLVTAQILKSEYWIPIKEEVNNFFDSIQLEFWSNIVKGRLRGNNNFGNRMSLIG